MILVPGKSDIKVLASGKDAMLHPHPDGRHQMVKEVLRGGGEEDDH